MNNTKTENLREDIKLKEYVAYAMGDFGCSMVFFLVLGICTYFYTDVMGVSPALVATILIISRVFDGISDLAIGAIADRTKSKHGKFRAWLLWMTIPFGVSLVLMYTIPPTNSTVLNAIYIFLTYNLAVTVVYTALNLPYGALVSVMTRDKMQRTNLNLIRMFFAPLGGVLSMGCCLPMVRFFGNDQRAWIITMTIFAFIGMACILCTFFGCKERIQIDATPDEEKAPTGMAIGAMLKNKYWWLLTLMCIGYAAYIQMDGEVVTYYCKYVLHDAEYMGLVGNVQKVVLSLMAIVSFFLVKHMTKRDIVLFSCIISVVGQVLAILNPESLTMISIASGLRGVGMGGFQTLMFTMVIDTVEYGHWRTGIRSEGLLYSANTIGQKVGTGLSLALVGFLLEAADYDGLSAVQSDEALQVISFLFNWMPVIFIGSMVVLCLFYKLDKEYEGIMDDLLHGKYSPKLDVNLLLEKEHAKEHANK